MNRETLYALPLAEKYMTRAETALYTGLGQSTLAKYFVSGDGPPAIKVGRCVRYRKSDIDSWMLARLRHSTADTGAAK